jgi:hypothetical protein
LIFIDVVYRAAKIATRRQEVNITAPWTFAISSSLTPSRECRK